MQSALILEDHREASETLAEVVKEAFASCQIHTAENLASASVLAAENNYSLALIDLNLPDGNGVDFISQFLCCQPNSYVVVVTIYDDDRHLFDSLRAGASGYLLKDNAKKTLVESLKAIVVGQPPLSSAIARRILRSFNQDDIKIPVSPSQALSVNGISHLQNYRVSGRYGGGLTTREIAVLSLVSKGFSRTEIAGYLDITSHTAASHIKNIYRKLNVGSRAEATLAADRMGFT